MRALSFIVMTAALALAVAGWSQAAPNTGAAEIKLEGGTSGPAFFPHQRHQQALGDCMACHSLFPQQAGSITALKAEGKLKAKQVMNTQCVKCHNERKNAGQKTGPITCTTCHSKKG